MRKLILIYLLLIIVNNSSYGQWIRQVPPITGYFSNVDFIDKNTGYIAGGYEKLILKTTNGGDKWEYSLREEGSSSYVLDVQIITRDIVYATMYHNFLKTTNGGVNWSEVPYPIPDLIYNIKFSSATEGFCIGEHGKILKTTNAGLNWVVQNSNTGALLWDIWMIDSNNFIVCGGQWQSDFATILKTTNKGENWISIATTNWGFFTNLFFINSTTGFVTGGNLLQTTDMGYSWNKIPTGLIGFNSIYFSSAKTGYAGIDTGINGGAYHVIYKSTDYGQSWRDIDSILPFYSRAVKFINDFTGWAIGETYIDKTSNGGSTFISNNLNQIPDNFTLLQNYPNPFNPSTKINFELKTSADISLNVYDVNGRLIKILESGYKPAGNYSTNFSAEGLSSGIFYYSLFADGVLMDTKKAILLK